MTSSRETDDLRELRELAQDVDPPPEIEQRIVDELRDRGLIEEPDPIGEPSQMGEPGQIGEPGLLKERGHRAWRPRLAVAAGFLAAALGGWVARGVVEAAPAAAPTPFGSEYMLILTEPEGLSTDKSLPELVGEYRDWAETLIEAEKLVTMRRLDRGGRDLIAAAGGAPESRPTPEAAEATGFFLVRAASLDEAVEIAQSCPHVGYGGRISVSEVARGVG